MKLEFHHINFVADDVDRIHDFYTNVLGLEDIPIQIWVAGSGDPKYNHFFHFFFPEVSV